LKPARICSVEGCGKPVFGHGWCNAHYSRWRRHGDPSCGSTAPGEAQRFYREVVLTYDGIDCLIWPYGKAGLGYGIIHDESGANRYVHRLVCEELHGLAPTSEHEAAHSCGRGHQGCVAKRHLSWKTSAGNKADQLIHGTRIRGTSQWNSKLTESDIREIRALRGVQHQKHTAVRFNVTKSQISRIQKRQAWGWVA
jgi:hypothetical protein